MPKLSDCTSFAIEEEESDTLFGGFREYQPPIYEQSKQKKEKFKTTELLNDIAQPDKKL